MKNFILRRKYLFILVVALLFCYCITQCNSNCTNKSCKSGIEFYERSQHRIGLQRADTLFSNYNYKDGNFKDVLSAMQLNKTSRVNNEYNTTEYVLINMETLKCYINFLEEVEAENDQKITGIAMFLGAENENATYNNLPFNDIQFNNGVLDVQPSDLVSNKDMKNRMTIFLAPTFEDMDSTRVYNDPIQKHQPFYIEPNSSSNKYQGKYSRLLDYFNRLPEPQKMVIRGNSDDTDDDTMKNSTSGIGGTSLALDELHTVPPNNQ